MVYYPPLTRMTPLTTISRERLLPATGEVLVDTGARVEPLTVVARADVPGRYYLLDVAQALGVSHDAADKHIQVKRGQKVKAGQLVAGRRTGLGLGTRRVRTPEAGVVIGAGRGRVMIRSVSEEIELRAGLPGTIRNVLPKLGVLIETTGALIQCVWGAGDEAFGVLKVVVDRPDQPLRARVIDVACHGAVLAGGSSVDEAALQQALELQVRAIIIGSLNPTLIELAQAMPFPIVVTEGLGKAPMATPIFNLLSTNDGREVAVSGHTQPRWGAIRPEVVIPLPSGRTASPPSVKPLAVGVQVRVIRGPAMGKVGTVQSLPAYPIALETGARIWGAMVALEQGEEQFVPFFNIELLC